MCSGCGGNPEEENMYPECLSCGTSYDSEVSLEMTTCPICKEPVCVDCLENHRDECLADKDCLSDV